MIPSEIFRQVRRIEITAGRIVNEIFAGQYHSTFKGRGMEFSEVREYVPGDDVRAIDWNVTARAGRPFVKKFVEERELTVIFLVDMSRSLDFGSRGKLKLDLAAEIAAVLAFSALRNSDKVGLILFARDVEKYFPPQKSRSHVLRLIREVLTYRPQTAGTSLRTALEYLNRVQRRRALVFLISDFIDDSFEKTLGITNRRHEIVAIPIEDDWEKALPRGVRLLLEDAESGAVSPIPAHQMNFWNKYKRSAHHRSDALRSVFRKTGLDAIPVTTGTSYIEPFLRFFRDRAKRLH